MEQSVRVDKVAVRKFGVFGWLISHQTTILFSRNKPVINNQPTVLFSQNKSAPATSDQPNEHAERIKGKEREGRKNMKKSGRKK
jgi:hypothetical protein